ncbi:hypothetical protein EON77_16215, partial [bacterium]
EALGRLRARPRGARDALRRAAHRDRSPGRARTEGRTHGRARRRGLGPHLDPPARHRRTAVRPRDDRRARSSHRAGDARRAPGGVRHAGLLARGRLPLAHLRPSGDALSPSRSARRVTPTQALLFRFTRSLVNGVRRAISSPKRILGIVFAVGYYWAFFIRPFSSSTPGSSGKSPFPDASSIKMAFPTPEVLSALLFGGFGVLTLLLTLGLFSFNAAFKSADVDVLFPTPISPRLVLVFRFLQGSFVTLLTPLTFAIFLYRPASAPVGAFFRDYPAQSAALMRNAAVAWVLLALATTSIGFAFSLLSGRDDDGAIRLVRWLRRAIPVLVLLPPAIFGLRLYFDPTLAGAVHAANDPLLRAIVPLATAATAFTVPGATGGWTVGSIVGF